MVLLVHISLGANPSPERTIVGVFGWYMWIPVFCDVVLELLKLLLPGVDSLGLGPNESSLFQPVNFGLGHATFLVAFVVGLLFHPLLIDPDTQLSILGILLRYSSCESGGLVIVSFQATSNEGRDAYSLLTVAVYCPESP